MASKVKLIPIVLSLLLLAGSLFACAPGDSGALQTQIVEAKLDDITVAVSADGNLSLPRDKSRNLTFEMGGTIEDILVKEGDTVAKGQVVAILERADYDWELKTLESALKTAEISLASATDTYLRTTYPYSYRTFAINIPSALEAMSSSITAINAIIADAESGNAAVPSEEEPGISDIEKLKLIRKSLVEAKEKLAVGEGDAVFNAYTYTSYWTIRTAQLAMDASEVAYDTARDNVAKKLEDQRKLELMSTMDGIVADVYKEVGDKISTIYFSTESIVQVVNTSQMELEADVDEIDIPLVSLGQQAVLDIDALPDAKINGLVTYISPLSRTEAGLVQYRIKVEFEVPADIAVKSGMTATADILLEKHQNVIVIPDRAIYKNDDGQTIVKLSTGEEETEERAVTTGLTNGLYTEIVSGIEVGDLIVIEYHSK
jgi:multidrug efflux pump subunit AcrA (membrane-fusion protein)